jgi:zinc protease
MITHQKILDIHHGSTLKGAAFYFVSSPNLPIVDIQIVFDAGSAREAEQQGLAYLTNTLIGEGTTDMDVDRVAEQFESLGVEFELNSYRDMATVGIRSLTETDTLNLAIETLTHILNKPAFLEAGFKREQSQLLMGLKYEEQRPDRVAQKDFYSKLYASHPYGNWPYGQEATVKKLLPSDAKAFYRKYYVAKNAVISIVGALSLEEAKAISEKISDALDKGESAAPLPEVADKVYGTDKIHFPSEQTHILVGAPGIKRGDRDFFALSLGNHILGGNGTVTRIFNEIRHKRGLAYDAHSYFVPLRERGPFVMGLQTETSQALNALEILQSTLKDFISEGPTAEELIDAKLNILGGYALLFDSNKAILSNLMLLGFYKLPLDYFDTYRENIEKVSALDIQDAFKRRIHPEDMLTVMVGQ